MHLSDAVLESVMVFRLGAGAVAEVVVPLCLAKAGFFSGCTVVLGIVAATEERIYTFITVLYTHSITVLLRLDRAVSSLRLRIDAPLLLK